MLEAEAEFETVSVSECLENWIRWREPLQSLPIAGPQAPYALGSGGVNLSPARTSASSQEAPGHDLPTASPPLPSGRRPDLPLSPGSGGGDFSRASSTSVHPDGTSSANPGPPSSLFRAAIAEDVGSFLSRALSGVNRGSSGRDRLALQSKYQGQRPPEPLICTSFAGVRQHCCWGGLTEANLCLWDCPHNWKLQSLCELQGSLGLRVA